jgi:hypothetical protein
LRTSKVLKWSLIAGLPAAAALTAVITYRLSN